MKRYHVISLILLLTTSNLWGQESIRVVLDSIAAHNLQLQALRHEQQAVVYDMKAENRPDGPSVEYSPFYEKGFTGVAESELIVSEEFDFPTRYAARSKQIRLQQDVHELQYRQARREVLLQAQQLCFDLVRTNQKLAMVRHRLADSESMLQLFEKRMEAGDANILELNKVKLDRMTALKQVSQTENEQMRLLDELRQLNGGVEVMVNDTIYPEQPLDADFESFLALALAADATVLTAQADARASQHEVSVSRQEWLPSLTVGYRRNTDHHEAVNGVVVGATFPLFATGAKVKAAKQRQLSAQLELEQVQLSAEQALRTRYDELKSLHRVLDHSDVEMLQQTLTLLGKALQHGEISALQYYTETASIYEELESHIEVHCESAKMYAELYSFRL